MSLQPKWWQQWRVRIRQKPVILVFVAVVFVGLFWEVIHQHASSLDDYFISRPTEGILTGRMPNPADPTVKGVIQDTFIPDETHQLMVVKHIPAIRAGDQMPHPFVGNCVNCHLFEGGAKAGSQFKTPAGALLEEMSRVHKMGPPLRANSQRPHPPAGRCIKCHNIVVKVPVVEKRRGFVL
ncbi:MAG: magnetochrome domain-containing protein [Zetaproteobacteria bacterium]|nr:magnetochrome domain-containing protein [Zetaproteobacteria bacterium]